MAGDNQERPRPQFFMWLPPPNAKLFDWHFVGAFPSGGVTGRTVIGSVAIPDGRLAVITDHTFFGIRPRAGDTPHLCDGAEFWQYGTFMLDVDSTPLYDTLTRSNMGPFFAGSPLMNESMRGIQPQMALYVRGPCTLAAVFTKLVAPDPPGASDMVLGARIMGWYAGIADVQRWLPPGAHL